MKSAVDLTERIARARHLVAVYLLFDRNEGRRKGLLKQNETDHGNQNARDAEQRRKLANQTLVEKSSHAAASVGPMSRSRASVA